MYNKGLLALKEYITYQLVSNSIPTNWYLALNMEDFSNNDDEKYQQ